MTKDVTPPTDVVNIMYIIDHLYGDEGGGTERHLSYLARNLDNKRFNPVIVAYDTGDTELVKNIKRSGVNIIHIPISRYYTPNSIKKSLKFARMIKAMNIDIVQTFHFKSDTIGVLSAKLAGVKTVISSKRDTGDLKKKIHISINKKINPFIDGFIAVADNVGFLLAEKEKLPKKKIKTIYNGVDINLFRPPSKDEKMYRRRSYGISEDDYVIGMVAVFRPEKNHYLFFNAFKNLAKSIKNIKAIVVGDGPLLKNCKEYCSHEIINNKIFFTGATKNVKDFLHCMDVACLVPSRNEGFSNSILEKMASGLPLIVSDIGGNSEAVINEFNGLVIESDNTDALEKAIMNLYIFPEKRLKMGENSRKRVEKYFSLEKMLDNYECYYNQIIGRS